jgi:hypothetical protein
MVPSVAKPNVSASARVGYLLVGLAIAVAALGDVFPHGV